MSQAVIHSLSFEIAIASPSFASLFLLQTFDFYTFCFFLSFPPHTPQLVRRATTCSSGGCGLSSTQCTELRWGSPLHLIQEVQVAMGGIFIMLPVQAKKNHSKKYQLAFHLLGFGKTNPQLTDCPTQTLTTLTISYS